VGLKLLPPDPETAALRAVAAGAIQTLRDDPAPPASWTSGQLPVADAGSIRAKVSADVARYFTPRLRARYEPMLLAAVDRIGTEVWDTNVSVSFDWDRSTITGGQATVSFTEHISLVRHDASGTPPWGLTGTWTDEMALVRGDGLWRVDSWVTDCAPNCP
jgi:hypothetical protein